MYLYLIDGYLTHELRIRWLNLRYSSIIVLAMIGACSGMHNIRVTVIGSLCCLIEGLLQSSSVCITLYEGIYIYLPFTGDIGCSGTVTHDSEWLQMEKYVVIYWIQIWVVWWWPTHTDMYPALSPGLLLHYPTVHVHIMWAVKTSLKEE